MKIATILPTVHLHLEDGSDYHLCLAHQVYKDQEYASFFRRQVRNGKYVILDNGAAERGRSMDIATLLSLSDVIECNEVVLPDVIGDYEATRKRSYEGLNEARRRYPSLSLMGVPQGKDRMEWMECATQMISWGIDVIGISKFVVPTVVPSRIQIMEVLLPHIDLTIQDGEDQPDIHLLGYAGMRREASQIDKRFHGRVRGIDSSIPTLYAQLNLRYKSARPKVALDLDATLDEGLLKANIEAWKKEIL